MTPEKMQSLAEKSKAFIFETVEKRASFVEHIIVATHYAPSWQSVSPQFINHQDNIFFLSDVAKEIFDTNQIDVWVHGHMHTATQYRIGHTTVACNPFGYPGETTGYNPFHLIDIPQAIEKTKN